MGFVIWLPFEVSMGQGSYLGDMSIFRPEQVSLVEEALRRGPEEGVTGKQMWAALGRAVPEHTVHLILQDMASKGRAHRETTSRKDRRAISVFRAL